MATVIKRWEDGSVAIAVEAGKDDMCSEGTHVHVYKNGRRTETWISLTKKRGNDLDYKDIQTAERLFDRNYREIDSLCDDLKKGKYDG